MHYESSSSSPKTPTVNIDEVKAHLISVDALLKMPIQKYGLSQLELRPNLYEAIVAHIISQMLSKKVSDIIFDRFAGLCNHDINPKTVIRLNPDDLRLIGISKAKAEYILDVSNLVLNNKIDLDSVLKMNEEEAISYLQNIKGVGIWTAEMICCFNLAKPNIFSIRDVALKQGILKLHKEYKTLSKNRFFKLKKLYSPYCSYAALLYYQINDDPNFV